MTVPNLSFLVSDQLQDLRDHGGREVRPDREEEEDGGGLQQAPVPPPHAGALREGQG